MLGHTHLHHQGRRAGGRARRAVLAVALALGGLAAAPAPSQADHPQRLYLVTLQGPGQSGSDADATDLRADQRHVLDALDAAGPVYSWTTALNGFAVRLTAEQAKRAEARPDVVHVERSRVRRLTAADSPRVTVSDRTGKGPKKGGAGTVIGVIDTGIDPDTRLFADTGGLGREPRDFRGACATSDADDWDASTCNRKLVGADWFVDGFGRDDVRSTASLSPRDSHGHGTQVASIAAGNAEVDVKVDGQRLGTFGGSAPQARVAAYKACWSAPDPADDGCSTADLVAAIDQATRDRVDVLSIPVGGPTDFDTIERALLGAAEAGIAVVAPAGNGGRKAYAAHPSPWVTTVGASSSPARRGRVVTADGKRFAGAMVSTDPVGRAPLVRATEVAALGVSKARVRVCAPGSLDASEAAGAIVICERGRVGRVDKSSTVRMADGAGMVLVNARRGPVAEDLHGVPTVHLARSAGRRLLGWSRRHPDGKASLRPAGVDRSRPAVTPFSQHGDPAAAALKPDVVAPGSGVLAGNPGGTAQEEWEFVTGTSASTATTAGVAARLISRRDLDASEVRSVLATSARRVSGRSVLATGSGRVHADAAEAEPLAHPLDLDHYRAWLDGGRTELNVPSILLADGQTTAERTVTHVGRRPLYFSLHAVGFDGPVRVTPEALWLKPGESDDYLIEVTPPADGRSMDDGYLELRSARGHLTRVPVAVSR